MDYFEMAADLPRDTYCMRQDTGSSCISRTQCVMCEMYSKGLLSPHYPVPAIPLRVQFMDPYGEYSYIQMMHIDALNHGEDDPVMVCCWDFASSLINVSFYGEYTVMGNAHG